MFTIDLVAEPVPNAAQTLEDPHFVEPESQQPFFDCITQFWQQHIRLFARQWEDYSNEAHLSAVMAAIQYSEALLQNQDDEVPDYEPSDEDDELSHLQNPTKTPIILNNVLRALPHYPIIHWESQMCNDPRLCLCPCSKDSSQWSENNKICIHHDHECKVGLMTPQELLTIDIFEK